jgi:hypothetical protein
MMDASQLCPLLPGDMAPEDILAPGLCLDEIDDVVSADPDCQAEGFAREDMPREEDLVAGHQAGVPSQQFPDDRLQDRVRGRGPVQDGLLEL